MTNTTEFLAKLPTFSTLSKAELRKIDGLMTPVNIKAGRTFIKEGSSGLEAFLIVDGTATVRKGPRIVATVGPGDVLGEMALLGQMPRVASVTAETDMKAEVLTRREFSALLDEVPGLSKKIMVAVLQRLRELEPGLVD